MDLGNINIKIYCENDGDLGVDHFMLKNID